VRHEPGEQLAAVRRILAETEVAQQVGDGPVVVVVGRGNLAEPASHTLEALSALLGAAPGARVLPVLRRGNVRGAIAAGLVPGEGGLDTPGIMAAASEGKVRCLVLLGADPLSDLPAGELADRALGGAATVIAVDTHLTPSSRRADLVLPAAGAGEKTGTTTNLEGRVTTLTQKITPPGSARPDWVIATDLATAMGAEVDTATVEELHDLLVTTVPAFAPATTAALAEHRDGVLLAAETPRALAAVDEAPPAPRSSYDLRLLVSRSLYDAGITVATSPSLAALAPGERLHVHPLDLDRLGATTGSTLKVSSAHASLTMEVEADAGMARGVAWLPFNQPGSAAARLLAGADGVIDVRLENPS
jgi:NADH-quinone oxidoreductase subunit G